MADAAMKSVLPALYIFVFETDQRFLEIKDALDDYERVSEVIVDFPTRGLGRVYVALIVNQDEKITHICRMFRLRTAGFNRRTVGLSRLEALTSKESQHLADAVVAAKAGSKRAELPIRSLESLTRNENAKVFERLGSKLPDLADKLREKGKADDRILSFYSPHEREIIGFERDVVGLALEIAFADREQLSVDAPPSKYDAFISMVSSTGFLEDEIVFHEKDRFPGLTKIQYANPRVTEFEHNGSTLKVIHANRNALEHTLGVDLIYISEYFGSFVGVQYKMMHGSKLEGHFAPNKGFIDQLKKMTDIWSKIRGSALSGQRDYRLSNLPFYFKFVSRLETNFSDDKLCPGLYLPFDLVSLLASAQPSERIGTKHRTRHLTNTEFANLIRQGWIGTEISQTNLLEKIVEDAFRDKHSITVAIHSGPPPVW